MRFAFVTTMLGSPWGASEELWSQTAVKLKGVGHDVCALVPYRSQLSEKVLRLAQQGISVDTYPAPSFVVGSARCLLDKVTLGTRRIYAQLRRFSPDLVLISQGEIAGGVEWARVCREAAIPYATIVHCNSDTWWFADEEVAEVVASYTAARKIFCVSNHNLNLLRLQLGEPLEDGEVVWNPHNVPPDGRVPKWPEEGEVWRLACVGRLDLAPKGQDLLVQILARPEWLGRPVELSLFGKGPHEQSLRRLCSRLGLENVRFRGHVSDVRAIWEQNQILVQPSRFEGVPITVIEAMWCGRPAVVTEVGRAAELCVDNETGFVASAATVPSFGHALERAWERRMEWQQMGAAARVRAENRIPKDPVALFCDQLKACAMDNSDAAYRARTVAAKIERAAH